MWKVFCSPVLPHALLSAVSKYWLTPVDFLNSLITIWLHLCEVLTHTLFNGECVLSFS